MKAPRLLLLAATVAPLSSCTGTNAGGATADGSIAASSTATSSTVTSSTTVGSSTSSSTAASSTTGGSSSGGSTAVSTATVGSSTGGAGTGGVTTGGSMTGGSMTGGSTTGGTSTGGTSTGGTSTGGTTTGGVVVDVEIEDSIPPGFKQPVASAGEVIEREYPCYYYTDATAGQTGDPSTLVLEPRDQPITKPVNIYLPPDYSADIEYPTIYVLHGITDSESTWFERGDPHPAVLLDNLIAAGEIQPVIAVFPNACSSSNFRNCGFDNQAGYYFFANELVNDLIPFIESEYSVKADRNFRALSGFSMGGMQTINTGLCQSLEHFAWFAGFAAAPTSYTADRIAEYLARENEAASYPINYFYNVCGASDSTARSSHEAAVVGLTERSEYLTEENFHYHTVPGDHNYAVSSIGLYNFLRIAFSN